MIQGDGTLEEALLKAMFLLFRNLRLSIFFCQVDL